MLYHSETHFYDWAEFFRIICQKIVEIARNNKTREKLLLEKANETFHSEHAILKYNTIDPFSYIYALAQRNTVNQRHSVFSNALKAFEIDNNIPTDKVFPTPTPNTLSLFFSRGEYIDKSGNVVGNDSLWNLFVDVYEGKPINEEDFRRVLSLKNVGFTKLSQALFLINPKTYIPFDTQMNALPAAGLGDLKKVVQEIEKDGLQVYLQSIKKLRDAFPGCELYEINMLNVLINVTDENQLRISNTYCQVSSWAYGQKENDYFNDFIKLNAVWTGGPAGHTGARIYPVKDYKKGDIVLVRRGTKWLGGIGIILDNGYQKEGWKDEAMIKIIWLVKEDRKIEDDALGQWDGFSGASEKTIKLFRDLYPSTFQFIDSVRQKQKIMINHAVQKHKNLILQGPPGTGKTRLAKQIAEWLTSEDEKFYSLIEAIDHKIFEKEPDIEANDQVKLIQFHPSYTYEDFVRGIKVKTEGEKIKYEVENRILASFAEEAAKSENQYKAYVLIIDEINRANLTAVLGELIYGLEYRGQSVDSLYKLENGTNQIVLPHNLYVIGTMNSADRSVSHIDYAIRRRFTFIPVPSNDAAITHNKAKTLFAAVKKMFDECTSPEFDQQSIQIGHSYFLVDDNEIQMKLKYEIKPLLIEYVNDGVLLESARDKINDLNV